MNNASYPKFKLGDQLTPEQIAFFNKNGFIHFSGVASPQEVADIIRSTEDIQSKWIREGVKKINGVPIKFGIDENNKTIVHRFCFTSQYCEPVHAFVNSQRVKA